MMLDSKSKLFNLYCQRFFFIILEALYIDVLHFFYKQPIYKQRGLKLVSAKQLRPQILET